MVRIFLFVDLDGEVVHEGVELGGNVGTDLEIVGHFRREKMLFFVAQLVLQRGPEIHGDGAQLDLDVHHFFSGR